MPRNIHFRRSIRTGFFVFVFCNLPPPFNFFPLLGYPSSPTDLLHDHSLYMLIMCRSGEFVSGDTSETPWDCFSLWSNVQIYQILLAVINLLWKHWAAQPERDQEIEYKWSLPQARLPKGQRANPWEGEEYPFNQLTLDSRFLSSNPAGIF